MNFICINILNNFSIVNGQDELTLFAIDNAYNNLLNISSSNTLTNASLGVLPSKERNGLLSMVLLMFFISILEYLSTDLPFGKNSLICLFIFSTLGFWFDTYGSQKNNLHLSSPVILEKQIPSISVKLGSLSVKITGINSLNVSIPICSSNLSKNSTTLAELGLLIIFSKVNCKAIA